MTVFKFQELDVSDLEGNDGKAFALDESPVEEMMKPDSNSLSSEYLYLCLSIHRIMGADSIPQQPVYQPVLNVDMPLPALQIPVRAPVRSNPTSRKQSVFISD